VGQTEQLLDFFRPTLDADGRFIELDDEGQKLVLRGAGSDDSLQQLLTVARTTHSYAIGELLGVPGCAPIVERGLQVLWAEHRDHQAGGYFQSVDSSGPRDTTKSAYGHAFVLLAASSALAAGHDSGDLFTDVCGVLDEHFWCDDDGASREAFTRGWEEVELYRGANSNMHLCEAYLAAADAKGDRHFSNRAQRIAALVINDKARANQWMLPEHFDVQWHPQLDYNHDHLDDAFRPYGVIVGHLLEWSRLTLSTWLAGDRTDDWMREVSTELFDRAVAIGWDAQSGGLCYTVDFDGSAANRDKYWWPIAEGIAASATLLQVTGEMKYETWYRKFWDFAAQHFIDHARGGWYAELDPNNRRKFGPWHGKPDLYHSLQCSLLPLLPPSLSLAGALRDCSGDIRDRPALAR
jgi:mannose/cellobiose epimerase-like protein (N-acyl-D-glucosamine 2-epimerase family)